MGKAKIDESSPVAGESVHKLINNLIQLQELWVARAQEQAGRGPTRGSTQLDTSVEALMDALPMVERTQFSKLMKKGLLGIVPVSNQVCTACGMSLPKSLIQSIRQADRLYACPNCALMLYYPDVDFRGKGRRTPRGAPAKTGITRFSYPELMIPRLEGTTRDEVLAEMTDRLEEEGFIDRAAEVYEEALNREAIVSTALDHGLAFPHVRGVEGGGLILTAGVSKKGVKFDETSRKLSRIIFFVVIPTASSAFYLKLLAGLTKTFAEKEKRDAFMTETTPEGMWRALVKLTRSAVK